MRRGTRGAGTNRQCRRAKMSTQCRQSSLACLGDRMVRCDGLLKQRESSEPRPQAAIRLDGRSAGYRCCVSGWTDNAAGRRLGPASHRVFSRLCVHFIGNLDSGNPVTAALATLLAFHALRLKQLPPCSLSTCATATRVSRVSWNFGDDPCAFYAAAPTVSRRCVVFGWVCRYSAATSLGICL